MAQLNSWDPHTEIGYCGVSPENEFHSQNQVESGGSTPQPQPQSPKPQEEESEADHEGSD